MKTRLEATMNRQRSKSLKYSNLEDRKLLAGDVTVFESDQLYIRGDELSNQFAIIADEAGRITVEGRGNTTINGSTDPFVVSQSTNLDGIRNRNAAFDGGVRIMTFGGHDRIDIQGIEFGDLSRIATGQGNDFVRILNSTTNHDFTMLSGNGDDTFNFVQARARGDFAVHTAAGDDSVMLFNSRTWASTDVFSGTGDDSVTLERVRLTGDHHRVITYDGEDSVAIRNNNVNESGLDVYAGGGRDHVFAEMNDWNKVEGEILVAGQDGFDTLDVDADEEMTDMLTDQGFVSGESAEGAWWVYDRGDATPEPSFAYRASAVKFDQTTQINSIDWLGSYFGSEASESDNFVVEIYNSEAIESTSGDYWYSQPTENPAARFEIGNNANRVDTGTDWAPLIIYPESTGIEPVEGESRKIFSYSAEIDFEFLADTTYWISVYAINPTDMATESNPLVDNDFAVLVDFPGEPGDYFPYVPPTGTQENPYANTTAVLLDDNADLGLDPNRWLFTTSTVETIFSLNP